MERRKRVRNSRGRCYGLAGKKYEEDLEATRQYFLTGEDPTGRFTKPPRKRTRKTADNDAVMQQSNDEGPSSSQGKDSTQVNSVVSGSSSDSVKMNQGNFTGSACNSSASTSGNLTGSACNSSASTSGQST